MFLLHHNESGSCALHSWHQQEIPTLRFNQLAIASIKNHFNHHSLSVVCITKDSDTILLDTLAKDIDGMRLERIILWIQRNVTEELLHTISKQSEKHSFLQLLIVEAIGNPYNLSLKVMQAPIGESNQSILRIPDFQFNSLFNGNQHIKYINPYDISTIIVIVPCGREMRIEEVFKHLDLKSWLLHILLVYGIFVLAETFILVVTHRISGKAYRLTTLNPVLNLRAFRALLGMSFPVSRRSSLSLRQLFLMITVFGFVFSNFFSCKLSALLTKHSRHSEVRNFEELQTNWKKRESLDIGPNKLPSE
ncbi:uncharacterized protein [Drosophila takahashii]|uniref:uncharacterized protein n=1 Tax=Drosophila takahashii TaxID=29030 RepID=UPI0038995E61